MILESADGISEYERVELLGKGSFGKVYLFRRQKINGGKFIGFFAGKVLMTASYTTEKEF